MVFSMKNYILLVDMANCSQCHACLLACKDEHFGNDFPPYTLGIQELGENWVNMHIEERGAGSKLRIACWPEFCRHCGDPDCAKASNAVSRRPDGIVLIDPSGSVGDRSLIDACPNRAVVWNDEKGLPQKCTLCAHLLDAGETAPRCVEACPNGTLSFGDLNDTECEVARLVRENPELAGQSSVVRYYNRPGRFIAGSVYLSETEAAEGADVELFDAGECDSSPVSSAQQDHYATPQGGGSLISRVRTNGFGDFKFSNLPDNKQYRVTISLDGFTPLTLGADTADDVCWEDITLKQG